MKQRKCFPLECKKKEAIQGGKKNFQPQNIDNQGGITFILGNMNSAKNYAHFRERQKESIEFKQVKETPQ